MQEVFTSISMFLAATGVIIAVIYYFFDLRNRRKGRRSDSFMAIFTNINTSAFHEADMMVQAAEFSDYADFEKQYGPFSAQKPIHRAIRIVAFTFESIGMLLYRNLIDAEMVWDIIQVKHRWEKVAPIIKQLRKDLNEPRYIEWFEYLYNWYLKQEKRRRVRQQPVYLLSR